MPVAHMDTSETMTGQEDEEAEQRTVMTVRLKALREHDGYEFEHPIPLPKLSQPGGEFIMVAADPDHDMVTLQRSDSEEFFQFSLQQVSRHTHTEYRFEMPKRKPVVVPTVKRVTNVMAKVVAATGAAIGFYQPHAGIQHRDSVESIQSNEDVPKSVQPH